MTIGFDGSRAFVAGRTGTENYSFQLLKNLSLIDIENQYLIYITKAQASSIKHQAWPENFRFVTIGLPRLWTQAGLALRTFIDPLDMLFVPSHTLPLIRKPGLKTVITVHDLGAEYLPSAHQLKQVLYLNLMTHYQLKTASKLIAVSEATKKDIVTRVGVVKENIQVVYEGADKVIFKKIQKDTVNDIVKKYDIAREKYFLFVGTIQPRKNLERLIRAFDKFLKLEVGSSELVEFKKEGSKSSYQIPASKFQLILVGQKGWKSDEIYTLPKELGIEDKVRFLGRISDSDLAALYNGAIGLVYPSLFEGFGLPIVEAFACGCPVITSSISSMPEVTGNAGILVDPYNIEAISKAMRELAYDDTLRYSLIKKGIVRSEKFSWENCAKETLKVLVNAAK